MQYLNKLKTNHRAAGTQVYTEPFPTYRYGTDTACFSKRFIYPFIVVVESSFSQLGAVGANRKGGPIYVYAKVANLQATDSKSFTIANNWNYSKISRK